MTTNNSAAEELRDKVLKCQDCGEDFIFYRGEQLFFRQREQEMQTGNPAAKFAPPKRCKICRKRNKAERIEIMQVQAKEKERLERERPRMQEWKRRIESTVQVATTMVAGTFQAAVT